MNNLNLKIANILKKGDVEGFSRIFSEFHAPLYEYPRRYMKLHTPTSDNVIVTRGISRVRHDPKNKNITRITNRVASMMVFLTSLIDS